MTRPAIKRLVRLLTAVELTIACVAMVMIFVLILFQAVQRYLPVPQIVWTGELSQFALIWLTFAAAGVLVTRNGHIALQIVDNLPSPVLVRVVQALAMALVTVIAALFTWACWELVYVAGFLTSPALGLPMSWVYAIALVGLASTTLRAAVDAVQVARFGAPASEGSAAGPAEGPAEGEAAR
ncbi:TRAP transporter small permease [Promicromonospora panici]|uniref:TRAP transporter small permease n=1 Tax=Promicromonospora panici TaxID=2219658 RepID=UPI0013ECF405|nr:TRAP transporter small permease [Promicromonospora panici]